MADNAEEEVGKIVCQAHECIQQFPEDWESKMNEFTRQFMVWLQHPLGRNWNLIRDFESILNDSR